VTTTVYQSWLADRGIDSPGSQPFKSLASDISPDSSTLVLASVATGDASSLEAVARLSGALRGLGGRISWLAVDDSLELPSIGILRAVLPTLTNIIYLTSSVPMPAGATCPTEERTVASRPLRLFNGPTMSLMASDGEIKKGFWLQLQSWISSPH
jgi:hypothetical protein